MQLNQKTTVHQLSKIPFINENHPKRLTRSNFQNKYLEINLQKRKHNQHEDVCNASANKCTLQYIKKYFKFALLKIK